MKSLSILAAVVIGGLGSVSGAILGAFYIRGAALLPDGVEQYVAFLTSGIGVLTLLLFLPGGLARVFVGARDLLARAITGIDPRPKVVPASGFGSALGSAPEPQPVGGGAR